jgi:hypothetical protein
VPDSYGLQVQQETIVIFFSACKSSHSTHATKQLERHGPCPGEMMALLLVLT